MAEASTRTWNGRCSCSAPCATPGDRASGRRRRARPGSPPRRPCACLRTLEGSGFVRRDDDGDYRPGMRLVQLGAQALSHESLGLALPRSPLFRLVVDATGESAYLSMRGAPASNDHAASTSRCRAPTRCATPPGWGGRMPLAGSPPRGRPARADPGGGYVVSDRGVEQDVTAIAALRSWAGPAARPPAWSQPSPSSRSVLPHGPGGDRPHRQAWSPPRLAHSLGPARQTLQWTNPQQPSSSNLHSPTISKQQEKYPSSNTRTRRTDP